MDAIAWRTLDAIVPRPWPADRRDGEVRNYLDMWERIQAEGDQAAAWSAFLHQFFRHRDPESFAYPPPSGFGQGDGAMMAGAAEYLCRRYGLPIPSWTEEPQYFLNGRWELLPAFQPEVAGTWVPFPFLGDEESWPSVEVEFRRRGLFFQARNLITL